MRNKEGLVATYTASAIGLLVMALLSYFLSTGVNAKPIVTILIAILAIIDIAMVFQLAMQNEVSQETIYGLFLFIGLSALLILVWFDSSNLMTAGLCLGYALAFLLGIAVALQMEMPMLTAATVPQRSPQPMYTQVKPTVPASTTYVIENKGPSGASKQELKEELDKQAQEVKRGEQQVKREIKQDIQTVRQQVQDVKNEITLEVKKALRQRRAPPKEKTFFVASKTGKSLHRKNCIVLDNIPKKNRVTFDNEKVAVKQGYKLCKVCFPAGKV
ncbi:MAG TPA: hypothetical protein VJB90_01925 [Candidatus Nanoarchaeia archaeon]|nr:hypothetical protein [Candidatus Nanoarchaeia archaeon]